VTSDRDAKLTPAEWESTTHLVTKARAGDRSAAGALLERAVPHLRRWTRGRIPSYGRGHADTEDIVQDAIVQTLRRIDTFDHRSVGALQAFLREVVVNRIRDVVRRVRRRGVPEELPEEIVDKERSPLEIAIMQQRTERFVAALAKLRPVDRQAVVCRIELGYSYREIAERLGNSTEAAARMKVHRALQRLAVHLDLPAPAEPAAADKRSAARRSRVIRDRRSS
jgi:RNA polymerase sigma factor (sigma-70 family)